MRAQREGLGDNMDKSKFEAHIIELEHMTDEEALVAEVEFLEEMFAEDYKKTEKPQKRKRTLEELGITEDKYYIAGRYKDR